MREWVVHQVLEDAAHRHPSVEVVSGARRFSYEEILDRVLRLADRLWRLGMNKGTVVSVMDVNSHRYLELKFALSMTGAVLHTANFRLPVDDLLYTVEKAQAEWLMLWPGFGDPVARLAQTGRRVVWLSGVPAGVRGFPGETAEGSEARDGRRKEDVLAGPPGGPLGEPFLGELSPGDLFYEELIADGVPVPPDSAAQIRETDPYSLFFTTGTTGRPKGIVYRHRDMLLASLQIAHHLALHDTGAKLGDRETVMPLIPFFHIHGWGVPFFGPYLGVKLVLPERADAAGQAALIAAEGVTWANMVPTQLQMLLDVWEKEGREGGRRLSVLTGGSPLSAGLAMRAVRYGVDFSLIYGGSDQLATAISTVSGAKAASVGTGAAASEGTEMSRTEELSTRVAPLPMVRVEVRDPDGNPLPRDGSAIGEVWVQSPWLPPGGYLGDPERTAAAYKDGWFRSGDLAFWHPDGRIYVADRKGDAVKSGGEWIATGVLEAVLSEISGVRAAAVVGMPDERFGERPVAVLSADPGVREEDVRSHLETAARDGRIARFWIPDRTVFRESLPVTSAGKIDKRLLREELGPTAGGVT